MPGTELTTGGTDTPSGSVNTASVSPSANRLVDLIVRSVRNGAVAPGVCTASGNSLTYVEIDNQTFTDSATQTGRLTRFRAMGASPSAGAITIAHAADAPDASLSWQVVEYSDVDTSGTNGSGAVVQSAKNSGTSASPGATLAGFGDTVNNAVHVSVGSIGGTSLTPEAGYTGYTTNTQEGGVALLRGAWKVGEDTSPSMTLGASGSWAAIAIEIKARTPPANEPGMPMNQRAA